VHDLLAAAGLVEFTQMTAAEWALFSVASLLCVSGLLLPRLGNRIGRAVVGESPEVEAWRRAQERRGAWLKFWRRPRRKPRARGPEEP
jgi:hypothetical protein